jgi:hypothetical protein
MDIDLGEANGPERMEDQQSQDGIYRRVLEVSSEYEVTCDKG